MKNLIDAVRETLVSYSPGCPVYLDKLTTELNQKGGSAVGVSTREVGDAVQALVGKQVGDTTLHNFIGDIYYRTVMTPFGETRIDKNKVIYDLFLSGGNGYLTGSTFFHNSGLMTLIPRQLEIASNNFTVDPHISDTLNIKLEKPRTFVDECNRYYLQTLDAISALPRAQFDVSDPKAALRRHIERTEQDGSALLRLASELYEDYVHDLLLGIM